MKNKGKRMFKGTRQFVVKLVGEEKTKVVYQNAYKRYNELLEENNDEAKVMNPHTKARIYPAISIFESLLKEGIDRDTAAKVIYDFFDLYAEYGAKMLRGILKFPGLYKKVPRFAVKMIDKSFGKEAGFKSDLKRLDDKGFHLDMLVCPYHDICHKYHAPELVKAFCHSDDIAYGNMHKRLDWARTKTLGRGGDCCDFIINIKDK